MINSDGFTKITKERNTTEFNITKIINNEELFVNDLVETEMITELVHHIKQHDLVSFHETNSIKDKQKTINGRINVVPPGNKYANLVEDIFQIGDEVFTNEEIIEAVKAFFPERLV